jgi:hypothetical protein
VEWSPGVGGVRREVKVEVLCLLKEGGLDGVAGDCKSEVHVIARL